MKETLLFRLKSEIILNSKFEWDQFYVGSVEIESYLL